MSADAADLAVVITPAAEPPTARRMVAITADATDDLSRRGIVPTVIDDVVDRRALLGDGADYVRWQLDWFSRLDEESGANGAVVASAQMIKPAVDSVVVATRLATGLLDALDPATIELVTTVAEPPGDPLHAHHLQFWPRHGHAPLWRSVLPIVAATRGTHVSVRPAPDRVAATAGSPSARDRVLSELAERTGILRHFDLVRWRPHRGRSVLFLWTGGYGQRHLVGRERAGEGRRILALARGAETTEVFEPVPWGRRRLTPAIATAPLGADAALDPAAASALRRALDGVDERLGIPGAGSALESRLDAFLRRVVPQVSSAATQLDAQFERCGVTSVVTTNSSSIEEFAALLTAGRRGVERVLAQHGDHLFSYDGWFVNAFWDCDVFLTSDPSLVEDLPEAADRLGVRAPVVIPSHHRRTAAVTPRPDGPVCYVPAVLMGDTSNLPALYFDDAWYHRWHLRLLQWMRGRPTTQFLWKGLPSGDHVDDPIFAAVADAANVEYSATPFARVLPTVSSVFTDFPSTPAFEAADAGVPLRVLWFPRFGEVRPLGLEVFGAAASPCDDENAALSRLDEWLDRRR